MKPSDWVFLAILAGIAIVGFATFSSVASKGSKGSTAGAVTNPADVPADAAAAGATAGGHEVAGMFYTSPGSVADSIVSFFEGL